MRTAVTGPQGAVVFILGLWGCSRGAVQGSVSLVKTTAVPGARTHLQSANGT